MKNPFHAAGSVIIASMIIVVMASSTISCSTPLLFTRTAIASTTTGQDEITTTTTGTTVPSGNVTTQRVAVGGGNITLSINQFSPQTVDIQPGESVTFFAPPGSLEIHNVIFDLSNGTTISDIGVPFILPLDGLGGEVATNAAEELVPAPPYNLGEPIIQNLTDGITQAIIGFNKVAFYPTVVDENGNIRYLEEEEINRQMLQMGQAFEQGTTTTTTTMPPPLSTSYTMDGTESVVSSGIILDVNGFSALRELFPGEGEAQPQGGEAQPQGGEAQPQGGEAAASAPLAQFPFLGSFTVTFSEPGTYDYFCAFHPGMFGQVVVSSGEEGQTNQT
jgi:plastocyanin